MKRIFGLDMEEIPSCCFLSYAYTQYFNEIRLSFENLEDSTLKQGVHAFPVAGFIWSSSRVMIFPRVRILSTTSST